LAGKGEGSQGNRAKSAKPAVAENRGAAVDEHRADLKNFVLRTEWFIMRKDDIRRKVLTENQDKEVS